MEAPNKIFVRDFGNLLCQVWTRDKGKKKGDVDVEYIRKDLLMEWLAERKKHYQGLIPAEGAVAFICALDEVKHKIESI